jgi:uncharacterized protein
MIRTLAFALALALHVACACAGPLGPAGEPGRSLPGKFVWLDLATVDLAGARDFYGDVFGWRFREVEGAPASYTLIENAGVRIGGMFHHRRPPNAKVGSRWLAVMSVRDVSRAANVTLKQGGAVLLPPNPVAGRGVHAVLRAPDGAVFGVLAAEGGDPPDVPVRDGEVFWLDLFTPDLEKAGAFYAELAGYEVTRGQVADRARVLLSTSGIARAGIAHLPAGAVEPAWLPYILVEDVGATLERVRGAAGRIVMEPRPGVLEGNLAVIADPEGGVVGIVNWPRTGRGSR